MEIWSKCDICGRDIPVGELCYGLKKGNCICKDCCTGFENCTFTLAPAPTLTPPNEWVSVEERLPTIEKDYGGYGSVSVNIFNGKSVLSMDYESSVVRGKKVFRWKYPWNRIYDGEPITHWRPLPEPPKKEG